jgi:hypothetical protein
MPSHPAATIRAASARRRLLWAARATGATVAAVSLVAHGACGASAAWASSGSSRGTSAAASLNTPTAPAVTRSGSAAAISWATGSLSNGTAATGYIVKRHVGTTTTTTCTTAAPTLSCTDTAPVSGTQTYGVVATYRGWSSPESPTTTFVYDTTAPTVTATATGTPNAAGWMIAASSTVTISAADSESGVASVAYRINSTGAWNTISGASTSFTVTDQGTTTITYYATDTAGNVATNKTLLVKLDNIAPTVTTTYPPSGTITSALWNGNCRNTANVVSNGLCGTSADATSGVSSISYELRRTPLIGGATVCWNSTSQTWTNGACGTYRATAQGPTGITSWYVPLPATGLGTGNFELRIRATDTAGNTSPTINPTRTFTVLV